VRLGIFGWPVAHSLSPKMQSAALAAVGLGDWTYEAIAVEPTGLAAALERLRAPEWRGANVTIPHKEAACAMMDALAGDAREIGAVNTIVVEGGRLVGHNTDAGGFLDVAGDVRGQTCAVLGAGGSARAVVFALLQGGAGEIRVLSRRKVSVQKARACGWEADALSGCELVVSCVPPEASPPPFDRLLGTARLIDLVYYRESAVSAAARERGLTARDGLEVLIRQGARAFELWTGRAAPLDVMRQAVGKK
jgi:shikimate dehydrogenase